MSALLIAVALMGGVSQKSEASQKVSVAQKADSPVQKAGSKKGKSSTCSSGSCRRSSRRESGRRFLLFGRRVR